MRPNKIIYIGIINDEETKLVGGFAIANERNINEYVKRGYTIEILKFPVLGNKNLKNGSKYLWKWFQFISKSKKLAKKYKNDENVLVHITPNYKHLVFFEYLTLRPFFKNKLQILIDVRAGSFIRHFQLYGNTYRKTLTNFLKMATLITVEGVKYISFIEKITNSKTPIHYYPNYVSDNQILQIPRESFEDELKLIYFGRITKDKGILLLIETHQLLEKKYNTKTTIIGEGDNKFIEMLQSIISEKNLNVNILPSSPKAFINQELVKSHFFIFPTVHKGEGHSNSLTEAMAYGVVPVVSDNGFNKGVVKNAGKVLRKEALAKTYFQEIDDILSEGRWQDFSERARKRILENYSNEVVSSNFFKFIKNE